MAHIVKQVQRQAVHCAHIMNHAFNVFSIVEKEKRATTWRSDVPVEMHHLPQPLSHFNSNFTVIFLKPIFNVCCASPRKMALNVTIASLTKSTYKNKALC